PPVSFQVDSKTRFEKVTLGKHQRSSFSAEHKGQDVIVYPHDKTPNGAAKVEVIVHLKPAPPVQGKIVHISKDKRDSGGKITVQPATGKAVIFHVDMWTRFQKRVDGYNYGSSFVAEHRGQFAQLFPRPGYPDVADRVAILVTRHRTAP